MRTHLIAMGVALMLAQGAQADIAGRWDLTVGAPPHTRPSWIKVEKTDDGHAVQFLAESGSVERPPADSRVEDNTVSFQARGMRWQATAEGDTMKGVAVNAEGHETPFVGNRFVPEVNVTGRWELKLEDGGTEVLLLDQQGSRIRARIGDSPWSDLSDTELVGDILSFTYGPQAADSSTIPRVRLTAVVKGDVLEGALVHGYRPIRFTGQRERQWGEPIELFNGRNLDGWRPLGDPAHSKWEAADGLMSNTGQGANIVTERKFDDFKLHVEFRVPERGNSGVYLRGRHEVQVADSHGRPPSDGGCGGLYSRITPKVNACGPAGEWQTFDITLIGMYLTVVHNGQTIIENQDMVGITGGAIDSNTGSPGPIYLQGDHTAVDYRKLTLTPALRPKLPE